MAGLLLAAVLVTSAILGTSMLVSPESYAGQRTVPALRNPLACKLAGLALVLAALLGGAAAFLHFAMSNYSE